MRFWKESNVLLVVLSITLALLLGWGIGEVVVRSQYPYWDLSMALKYSPTIFAKHVITPKKHTVHHRGRPQVTLNINEQGYRGDSITVPKPDNQTRIMIYGGSQVFSAGTGRKGWPERTEDQLRKLGLENVQVINAGVPGLASYDSMGRLFAYGHYLEPDVVILDNAWNDIKYFHVGREPLRKVRPYDRSENPRRYYVNALDRFLGQHSQFYLLLRTKYYSWGVDPGRGGNFRRQTKSDTLSPESIKQYRIGVETFVSIAESIGARPMLLKQPRLLTEDLSEDGRNKIRFDLTPERLLEAYKITENILERTAATTEAEVISLKGINGQPELFYDKVHFTEKGARKVAGKLARELQRAFRQSDR